MAGQIGGTSVQTFTRRSVVLGALAAPVSAIAQGWPATVRLVVPYPPAGSTDVIARMVQPELQRRLGATVIVENRPGASGSIGTAAVAKSPPDGGSWLIVFDNHAANPFVLNNLPFDTEKDLDPVLLIGTAPYVLATNPSKPFKTLADVIAAARAKPDTVSYGSVGSGSVGHLAMALLSKQAGVRLVHVPYRGGGPAMNDAIAGHVDLLVGSTALSIPQIQAGTIKTVAQTGKARTPALGTVPTVSESGFPDFEAYAWWGVFAPAGTPAAMVARFNAELTAIIREPRIAAQLSESQQITLALSSPQELRTFLSGQMKVWGAVAREFDIKGE
jgi:tripartite-type tricarboxylate transporter receptor subunit TctC